MRRVWLVVALTALVCFGQAGRPDDISVVVEGDWVRIQSSGISTTWFGRLATPPVPADGRLRVDVRIPARPVAADVSKRTAVPIRYSGVFRNGTPIWNQVEVASFEGRNIWHYDLVKDAARSRHGVSAGMLEALVPGDGKASSIVGFALDGYPVYGPWAEVDGRVRRMRSGYRLRNMARRLQLPDGTKLTPGQYGPEVDALNPLGTFAEDYEYVAGSGDLDECNGRFVKTSEYPAGTYAYFLSTDEAGGFAYPYLTGPRFHGVYVSAAGAGEVRDFRLGAGGQKATVAAGEPVRLRFRAAARHLERVHERPLHLMVVSEDLKEFDHIHPELTAGEEYEVVHTFRRGGRYRLFADYVAPGGTPQVEPIDVIAEGSQDGPVSRFEVGEAELDRPKVVRVDEDVNLRLRLRNVDGLQPFLGAWAHFAIVNADLGTFIHAHPVDPDGSLKTESGIHVHGTEVMTGPVPSEIRTVTSFHRSGRYRVWAQFQRAGRVMTVPFDLDVVEGDTRRSRGEVKVPAGAIRVRVSKGGFEPTSVPVPAGRPVVLAVLRDTEPNCGGEIVFPGLGIRKAVGLGETLVVELPARESGTELRFTCGMGMYRGLVVVR